MFTVVSPNSLRFRCGVLWENGSSRLGPMGDAPTDLVCIARPVRQARCTPQVQIPEAQPPIPTFANGDHLKNGRGVHGVFRLEVEKSCSVFYGRSDIFVVFGPLRSLPNFPLSEWRLPAPWSQNIRLDRTDRFKAGTRDLVLCLPSFISRVCSGTAPEWRVANSVGVSPLRLVCGRLVL